MFYDNLKHICDIRGLKITPTIEKCGVKGSASSKWKNGSSPNSDIIISLAEYLNVSTDYLLFGKEPSIPTEYKKLISSYQKLSPENQKMALGLLEAMYNVQTENEKRKNIKIIQVKFMPDTASAGQGTSLWNDGNGDYIDVIETPESLEADYAVKVEGDSMLPDYKDGDIVLVKQQDTIELGQIGIFTMNNNQGFIKESGENCLISHNPEYDDIVPTENDIIECNGLVLGKAILV